MVDYLKYLEAEICRNFDWTKQTDSITSRTVCYFRLVHYGTPYSLPLKVKLLAFKSLCIPLLEYACEVCDPHLVKHQEKFKRVQSRTVRFSSNISVSEAKADLI